MLCLLMLFVRMGSTCDTQNIHGSQPSEGLITSPRYPLTYPPDSNCLYKLTAASGLVIRISFIHFELERPLPRSNQCFNDYVIITVTDRHGRDHIGDRYCGLSLPPPIQTMQNTLTIRFHSSRTNQYPGFKLHYQFLPEGNCF